MEEGGRAVVRPQGPIPAVRPRGRRSGRAHALTRTGGAGGEGISRMQLSGAELAIAKAAGQTLRQASPPFAVSYAMRGDRQGRRADAPAEAGRACLAAFPRGAAARGDRMDNRQRRAGLAPAWRARPGLAGSPRPGGLAGTALLPISTTTAQAGCRSCTILPVHAACWARRPPPLPLPPAS